MNDEGNNENSNMNDDSTPSTAPDVMPSGGATLGQAAKQKAKNTVKKGWDSFKNAVGRGLKALWKFLPLQVKIIVIVILCILIVLAALLLMGMMEEGTSTVTTGVDNFMSDSKDIGKDAKSLYEDKASLIKVKLKDINAMYDKFIDEEKGGAETQTLMKYKIGTKDVKEDNKEKRIVNVEDKLPLYKHILLTEKYNFNNVDWKKFSHNASAGEDVKDFKEDKERGLKYPDTKKNNAGDPKEVKLDKFIDLTLPYLQTWYIPLAMSNASVLNGTESDNNRAPAFSYNIIKEAYSNIVANWYELKKHTTVTRYYTYDEIKKHDMVTVEVIEREYENGAKNYSLRLGSSQTFEDSRTPKNTRTTSGIVGGTVDPMKEEAVSQKDEYTSHFYIKEADVFDAKIVNQFNYQVYNDSDAAKRRNADSTNESTATYAKTMSTEDINKKGENAMDGLTVDENGNISGAYLDKVSRFGDGIPQNDPTNTTKRTTAYSYNVTFKQYTDYENGLEHTVTRIWKDKLSQTGSETSDYTIDDLIMYNQSDKRKEKVDATALCGVVITKRSGSSSSSSSTSSGSTSSGNSSSSSSSNNSTSNSNKSGQGKVISTSNVNSTGYTGIYESRTTGRKFKEYKQNGNSYVFRYDISSVGCSWSSECGTVSTMIVGSGYSTKATFEDATKKLKSTGGGTQFTPWLSDYASDAKVKTINSPSQSQLKKLLKEGCVAVVHDPGYSANGHYMAILDISRDGTQIYVSNPDSYNAIQNGWNPISVFYSDGQYLTDCYFVSNKGNVTEYSGDSSDGSEGGADTTCTGTKSGKYYTSLKKTDGLNRIDFMNSNPDIFHRYIREGGEYYEYVGYSRSKLSLSYWNLKNVLQKIYDKKGSLPWAYGKTLGFENIYSSGGNSSSSVGNSSGRGLQAMVDKAIELSKANGGEGVWHYCWGAASGFTHANARFTFSTIDEMNKYIEIGKSAGLDCSAFVLSMYKAYTGADIDPGGAGSTMVSYARSHNGQSLPGSENVTIEYHDSLDDNIQVGDVLFMTGHVGIYAGRDNSGNIMTVDHGGSGSSINCSLADGSNWTGPKYRNGSWFEGYIHYDGLSSGGASGLNLTVEQIKDFAVMIYGEAGGNSYELKVACAAAAINQYKAAVAEGKNVDFLKDFIHNTSNFNGYGAAQGHQVSENDSVYKAAVDALNGEDPTGGALYFYAPAAMIPPGSTSEWHESLTYLCTIDGVRFFKP